MGLDVPAEKIVSKIHSSEFFNVIVHFRVALQSATQPRIHPVKHLRPPGHCLSAVLGVWANLERSAFEVGDTTFFSLLKNYSALLAVVSFSGRCQQ